MNDHWNALREGQVSTATLTTILLKKGLRNVWLRGPAPLAAEVQPRSSAPPSRCASCRRARTWRRRHPGRRRSRRAPRSRRCPRAASPWSTRRACSDAGIFGDILCARMAQRGVAALVTDGVVRDVAGVLGTGLPVWCQGVAAPPSVAGLTFVGWQEPIGCGGVAVFPERRRRRRRATARWSCRRRCWPRWCRRRPSRSASRPGSWARSRPAARCPACTRPTRRRRHATPPRTPGLTVGAAPAAPPSSAPAGPHNAATGPVGCGAGEIDMAEAAGPRAWLRSPVHGSVIGIEVVGPGGGRRADTAAAGGDEDGGAAGGAASRASCAPSPRPWATWSTKARRWSSWSRVRRRSRRAGRAAARPARAARRPAGCCSTAARCSTMRRGPRRWRGATRRAGAVRARTSPTCSTPAAARVRRLAVAAQRSRRSLDDLQRHTPADGLITGTGSVNAAQFGPQRRASR